MTSDKHTLLRLWAWFLHCSTLLHPEKCLFANRSSSSVCIMVLPLLSFELHSFLHCRVGDNLRYTRYGLGQDLGKCSASRGTSYVILCLECCSKMINELQMFNYRCTMKTPKIKGKFHGTNIINRGLPWYIQISHIRLAMLHSEFQANDVWWCNIDISFSKQKISGSNFQQPTKVDSSHCKCMQEHVLLLGSHAKSLPSSIVKMLIEYFFFSRYSYALHGGVQPFIQTLCLA